MTILESAMYILSKSEQEVREYLNLDFDTVAREEFREVAPVRTFDDLVTYYKNSRAWLSIVLHSVGLDYTGSLDQLRKVPDFDLVYNASDGATFVLDFGCGAGAMAAAARHRRVKVAYADLDTPYFRVVKRLYDTNFTDMYSFPITEEFPLDRRPYERLNGVFDFIICREVLEHVLNPVGLLQHLVAHLVPGGYIYLTAWFHNNKGLAPYHVSTITSRKFRNPEIWAAFLEELRLKPTIKDATGTWKIFRKE